MLDLDLVLCAIQSGVSPICLRRYRSQFCSLHMEKAFPLLTALTAIFCCWNNRYRNMTKRKAYDADEDWGMGVPKKGKKSPKDGEFHPAPSAQEHPRFGLHVSALFGGYWDVGLGVCCLETLIWPRARHRIAERLYQPSAQSLNSCATRANSDLRHHMAGLR